MEQHYPGRRPGLRFHTSHFFLRASLLLALLAGIFACAPTNDPPLRVGSNVWPGYEPLYLARELGLYADTAIHLVELPTATSVMHHLRNGTIEAACLTLDEFLSQLQKGMDLQVVMVMDFSRGADVLLANPAIPDLAGLRGKTIGVENTATGAILLDGALSEARLDLADVKIKYVASGEHEKAYLRHKVDAIVTFEPVKSRLLRHGAKPLFDSSRIPERIIDVLVVRKDVVDTHRRSLRKLLQGYFLARQQMQSDPQKAARLMAPRLGVPTGEVLALFRELSLPDLDENRRLLEGEAAPLLKSARQLARLMLANHLLTKPLESERIQVRADLLPEPPR